MFCRCVCLAVSEIKFSWIRCNIFCTPLRSRRMCSPGASANSFVRSPEYRTQNEEALCLSRWHCEVGDQAFFAKRASCLRHFPQDVSRGVCKCGTSFPSLSRVPLFLSLSLGLFISISSQESQGDQEKTLMCIPCSAGFIMGRKPNASSLMMWPGMF